MEQTLVNRTSGKLLKRRSRLEVFAAIEEFKKAGNISAREFARRHQITETTFYNWQKKYRARNEDKNNPNGFIPVRVEEYALPLAEGLFAEVGRIRFYQRVEANYLKELLS